MAWNIDTAHTSVGFVARHMGLSKVRGQFTSFRGEVDGDPSDITTAKGWLEVDLASIDTGNADRDAHLKSADFFDVEKWPTMRFVSKRIERNGDDYRVVGDLTIKDVTAPVTFAVTLVNDMSHPMAGTRLVGFTATTTLNRSDWGLGMFAPAVPEDVTLVISTELAETPPAPAE